MFRAALVLSGRGTFDGSNSAGEAGFAYANFTLDIYAPGALDPGNFGIEVSSPNGSSIPYPETLRNSSVNLTFVPNADPPWLATLSPENYWSGFTAVVTDPNGVMIGHVLPGTAGSTGPPYTSAIESHAIVTVTFPSGLDPTGYSISVTCRGLSGAADGTVD